MLHDYNNPSGLPIIEWLYRLSRYHGLRLLVQCDCPEPWRYALLWQDDDGDTDIISVGETWAECCEVAAQEMAAWG